VKDLIFSQAKINESLNKKLAANDKSLENINIKTETLSSILKNQLSFNKMIETQLAQIAAADSEPWRILGQREAPVENVSMINTRWGKLSWRPFRANHVEKPTQERMILWGELATQMKKDLGYPMTSCRYTIVTTSKLV
jgi:hypothetical protein